MSSPLEVSRVPSALPRAMMQKHQRRSRNEGPWQLLERGFARERHALPPHARILVGDGPRRRPHDRRWHLPDALGADRRARLPRAHTRTLARLRRPGPGRRAGRSASLRRGTREAGGLYVYLREAWGRRVAFLYGWQCLLVMDPGVTAALALGLAQYAGLLWPAAAGRERWLALAAVWIMALVEHGGTEAELPRAHLLTAFKVLALAGRGRSRLHDRHRQLGARSSLARAPRGRSAPRRRRWGSGSIGVFFSFGGFWEASRVAGEIRGSPAAAPAGPRRSASPPSPPLYVADDAGVLVPRSGRGGHEPAAFARPGGEALLGPPGARASCGGGRRLGGGERPGASPDGAPPLRRHEPRRAVPAGAGVAPSRGRRLPRERPRCSPRSRALLVLLGHASRRSSRSSCARRSSSSASPPRRSSSSAGGDRRRPAGFARPAIPRPRSLFVLLLVAVVALVGLARPLPALAGFALVLTGLPVYACWLASPATGSVRAGGTR